MEGVMTQQACVISQLSIEFPQHSILKAQDLCLFAGQNSALIGRNGQGKSVILHYLQQQSSSATVQGQCIWQMPHAYLSQFQRLTGETLAQAWGIDQFYQCFKRIEQGVASEDDFSLVENHWHLPAQWQKMLEHAELNLSLDDSILHLSEGQKTKLALCALFFLKDHYLLLDEPTNHLDQEARAWLLECLTNHPAGSLMISHDQNLLAHMQHIYVLSGQHIQHYAGSYADYEQQNRLQTTALQRTVDQEKSSLKQLKQQQHVTRAKAQKRQQAGDKLRQRHSQAKILLDFKQNKAGQSLNRVAKQQERQLDMKQDQLAQHQQQLEHVKPQRFELWNNVMQSGEILRVDQFPLPNAQHPAVIFALHAGEKLRIKGQNGTGKSYLLHTIQHNSQDHIFRKGRSFYLDQHLSVLNQQQSVLENLNALNPHLSDVQWRNLLGQLRLKGEKALLPIHQLSGGEQLKVALLAVSQCHESPSLLLLDEPDNHLDLESKHVLAQALLNFTGSVLVVSHDAHFLQQAGITQQYDLTTGKVEPMHF